MRCSFHFHWQQLQILLPSAHTHTPRCPEQCPTQQQPQATTTAFCPVRTAVHADSLLPALSQNRKICRYPFPSTFSSILLVGRPRHWVSAVPHLVGTSPGGRFGIRNKLPEFSKPPPSWSAVRDGKRHLSDTSRLRKSVNLNSAASICWQNR